MHIASYMFLLLWTHAGFVTIRSDRPNSTRSLHQPYARLHRPTAFHPIVTGGRYPKVTSSGRNIPRPMVYVRASWSVWTPCSRTCGGGIKLRRRTCKRMRSSISPITAHVEARWNYRTCLGETEQYEICNTQSCVQTDREIPFRKQQCENFNGKIVAGINVRHWEPVAINSGQNQCELVCRANKPYNNMTYGFGKVIDGSRCGDDEGDDTAICVHGRCLTLGCDNKVASRKVKKHDVCGICGGSNDTCFKVSGVIFSEKPLADQPGTRPQGSGRHAQMGYNMVVRIPAHSTNIRAYDDSPNFLAIESAQNISVLNGDFMIKLPGKYYFNGEPVYYKRKHHQESIFIRGPLTEEIKVKVLILRDPQPTPGIYYEYWNPKPEQIEPGPTITKPVSVFPEINHTAVGSTRYPIWNAATEEYMIDNLIPGEFQKPQKSSKCQKRKCPKIRNRKKYFCDSDLVVRCRVINKEVFGRDTRYEVDVIQVYKNRHTVREREFLWSQDLCQCPRLKKGMEYIIMAKMDLGFRRKEVRWLIPPDTFVRTYSQRNNQRILKTRNAEWSKSCKTDFSLYKV